MFLKNGDIAVWDTRHGKYGHIAICTGEGTTRYFYSYDQNWIIKKMHKVKHSYKDGFAGVLRPRNQEKINGKIMKFKIGEKVIVNIPIKYTGAKSGNDLLVDSNGYQFWINSKVVQNYARIYGKGQVIGIDNVYKIELAGSVFDCKEQYLSKVQK